MNYEAAGVSRLYYDIELEAERRRDAAWAQLGKADVPMYSPNQCALCHRAVQEGEPVIRDGGRVGHVACVRVLIDLINAHRGREYVPAEPNMEAVRELVRESEDRVRATKAQLNRAININTRSIYK